MGKIILLYETVQKSSFFLKRRELILLIYSGMIDVNVDDMIWGGV